MSASLLNLSTRIKEPAKFTVDGREYQILGIDHLSPTEESQVMALFARHAILTDELSMSRVTAKGERIALQMKEAREALLGKLTDLDSATIKKLAVSKQIKLLEVIEQVVSEDAEEDEPADGEDAES